MSSQNQSSHDDSMANFTGIVLVLTFVIILALINVGTHPPTLVGGSDEQAEVAIAATEILLPTETPIPPTATSMPTEAPTVVPTVEATSASIPEPDVPAESSSSSYDASTIAYGQTLFATCSACHGADGLGIPNLGKNLIESEFVHSLTDDELVDFISTGRPMWDPANTTGIDMPAKGGNPALSNTDILAVVAYIRSLSE